MIKQETFHFTSFFCSRDFSLFVFRMVTELSETLNRKVINTGVDKRKDNSRQELLNYILTSLDRVFLNHCKNLVNISEVTYTNMFSR